MNDTLEEKTTVPISEGTDETAYECGRKVPKADKVRKTFTPDNLTKNLINVMRSVSNSKDDEVIETALAVFLHNLRLNSDNRTNTMVEYLNVLYERMETSNATLGATIDLLPQNQRFYKPKAKVDFVMDKELEQSITKLHFIIPTSARYKMTTLAVKLLAFETYSNAVHPERTSDYVIPDEQSEIVARITDGIARRLDDVSQIKGAKAIPEGVAE